ncbi:ABC transporter ATP-binding protein [Kibdelosporangium phytohabitans]|uniref:Fatty acid ABC transporter ATP-binding/permease protein n=1 Tax=Kibdelosporangium phytohabitans TaxID=860235 RepID=A0A0N9HQ97_9PSEU|nr:ABC transporter ATP-binding protein [Kibdelosporangium phytohabitans]ALG09285.1 multidrug ABC transporter ATP-binding protein [Kibdelosporangium phytohabitans]MBE1469463.1 ATP-binding cassette subfamily B protein [Kibdelosporangium phytohabitans]
MSTPTTTKTRPAAGGGIGARFGAMQGPPSKADDFGASAKRLVGRMRPERVGLAVVVALGVLAVGFTVAGPKVLGHATDIIFNGVIAKMRGIPGAGIDFGALGGVLAWVLGLYLTASLFAWAQGRLLNDLVQRVIYRLREDVEAKLHRLPLRYFDGQPRGELLSRVTNDIDNISTTLQQTMSQLLTSLLTVVGVVIMMFTISPVLALIALLVIPASMLLTRAIGKRSQKLFIAQWKHTGALNAHIEESFTGHQLVKAFGRQQESEEEFRRRNEELYQAASGAQFVSGLIMPSMMFLSNLSYVIIAVVGGIRITSGTMTLGEVTAFIQYSRQFTQPITQIASMANLLQSGVASAERVFELLDADEQKPDPADASLPAERRGRVEFEKVSFSYKQDKPLIENLSLVAEPGQTVAIVGPTGAGKTTLVNLIMRFYELDAGRITLDGVDITHLKREDLRSQTGMVLQDTWLFGGTIRDNIAYGKPGATDEEVVAAARATYVDRFVRTLPDGYDTVIDDEGTNVSAGEKQLLTIARAFLASPSLLILDEATSSVDTRTESLVQHAMAALRSSRTSFVIAHRLSTIRDADLILVMESGRIVEQGTHEQLLEREGAYHRLYSAQFAAPVE